MLTTRYEKTKLSCFRSEVEVAWPAECPICGSNKSPKELFSYVQSLPYEELNIWVLFHCQKCHEVYMVKYYECNGIDEFEGESIWYSVDEVFPRPVEKAQFSDEISNVSEKFVKVYKQACAAEAHLLDEICSMGYRKALECLIKDYAISMHPEQKDDIAKRPLSQCINEYVNNPNIRATAKAASWIGNDAAHYTQRWEGQTKDQLKEFINSCVYFILMERSALKAQKLLETNPSENTGSHSPPPSAIVPAPTE